MEFILFYFFVQKSSGANPEEETLIVSHLHEIHIDINIANSNLHKDMWGVSVLPNIFFSFHALVRRYFEYFEYDH